MHNCSFHVRKLNKMIKIQHNDKNSTEKFIQHLHKSVLAFLYFTIMVVKCPVWPIFEIIDSSQWNLEINPWSFVRVSCFNGRDIYTSVICFLTNYEIILLGCYFILIDFQILENLWYIYIYIYILLQIRISNCSMLFLTIFVLKLLFEIEINQFYFIY